MEAIEKKVNEQLVEICQEIVKLTPQEQDVLARKFLSSDNTLPVCILMGFINIFPNEILSILSK
jgi:hypothetical protein